MNNPNRTTFPIRLLVVSGFVASGWFVWCSAHWLVGHDAIYLRLHDTGFDIITPCAELVAFAGQLPALLGGLLLGMLVTVWLTRRRISRKIP